MATQYSGQRKRNPRKATQLPPTPVSSATAAHHPLGRAVSHRAGRQRSRRQYLPWRQGYSKLVHYAKTVGPVSEMPRTYTTADGFHLGPWVYTQQYAAATGVLASERAELLEKVNGWTWDRREEAGAHAAGVLRRFTPVLDRTSRVTLSDQIAEILRLYIIEGHYSRGERFPSEKELMKYFGTGNYAVKTAVRRLRDEGLLRFVQSRGVFVA